MELQADHMTERGAQVSSAVYPMRLIGDDTNEMSLSYFSRSLHRLTMAAPRRVAIIGSGNW